MHHNVQVDSPRDYASKVFTLMKIALGFDISEEGQQEQAQAASSSEPSSSSAAPPTVEPEVIDPADPWGKKL